ncbi:MAG: GyrI-like domain-containing protein [Fibrobacter sp.]|nr:GyrI-like domain-containing protein [Fibrobacter sp.]
MARIALIISGVVVIAILLVSFFAGVFDTVKFSTETAGPYNLIYREFQGPFSGIRFTLNDVFKYVRDKKKIEASRGFGIFYDDPGKTPSDSLRSITGVIVDSVIAVEKPYKSGVFEKTEAVVGRFPIRSFLSYVMGAGKFYSRLQEYLNQNNLKMSGPVLEVYDNGERMIIYIAPVNSEKSPAPEFEG